MDILSTFLPYQRKFFENSKKRKFWISSRQVGKTHAVAGILVYKALARQNGLSLCLSTGVRAASEIIRKCQLFAECVKVLSNGTIDYSSSYDKIVFSNGSRVVSLPSTTDGANLRGFTANCVVCDEACFIPHLEEIIQAIGPTLTRDPDSELIFASTPMGRNSYAYRLWEEAQDDPDWYTQETTIEDAISDGLKVDIQSLKSLCPDEESYLREYMCKWAAEDADFIDVGKLIFKNTNINVNESRYIFGYDVGRHNDKSAITVAHENSGILYVDDIIVLDKAQYSEQKAKLVDLKRKYGFSGGLIDQTGIGSAFAEDVTHTVDSRYRGFSFTGTNKTPLYESLRGRIFDEKIVFNEKLKNVITEDFKNIHKITTENGQIKYEAGRSRTGHSDVTSSLVLAVEAAKQFPANTSMLKPVLLPSAFGRSFSRL